MFCMYRFYTAKTVYPRSYLLQVLHKRLTQKNFDFDRLCCFALHIHRLVNRVKAKRFRTFRYFLVIYTIPPYRTKYPTAFRERRGKCG